MTEAASAAHVMGKAACGALSAESGSCMCAMAYTPHDARQAPVPFAGERLQLVAG